jgi:hypothetical protein
LFHSTATNNMTAPAASYPIAGFVYFIAHPQVPYLILCNLLERLRVQKRSPPFPAVMAKGAVPIHSDTFSRDRIACLILRVLTTITSTRTYQR